MTTAPPTRAADLPLTARIGQVNQRLKGWEAVRWVDGTPRVTDALRAEVDRFGGLGALYGVLRADPWSGVDWRTGIPPERSAEAYAAVQDVVVSRGCGVPTLFVEEGPHGLMALGGTTLPVNLALGAGMDVELTEELGAVVAAQARARGTHVVLVSGLDVLRDPRWGRAEECFSEDPALAAMLVAATVRGMQGVGGGPIDDQHVAVVAKHLAAQGAGIGGRNGSGAPIGRRELGEIHLRPAHAAAAAEVAGFMAAYNDIDGVACCGNAELLTATIRDAWGWDGLVMADGTAVDRLLDSVPTPAHAAALALTAGVDLSLWDESFTHVDAALEQGLLDGAVLTRAADRVLDLKRRVGLLGEPVEAGERVERDVVALTTRAARQSVVVLHDDDVLPLAATDVAVVGPNADDVDAQLGDYTPPRPADDPEATTVRGALATRLGADRVRFAPSCDVRGPLPAPALEEAAAACAAAGASVVVLGGTSRRHYDAEFEDNGALAGEVPTATNGEGVDLARLALPEAQLDVLRAARAAGGPVVAVVIDGRPRPLTEVVALADAVLLVPFAGPRTGEAVAAALLDGGASGRLPSTLPAADGVVPVAHDERRETARGYLDQREPRGPLLGTAVLPGVGLVLVGGSQEIGVAELTAGGAVTVEVEVTNDRAEPVSASVPLYGRRHELGVRPRRRGLLAVRRAVVPPGRSTVPLRLGLDELGCWAQGAPVARPVEVSIWCTPELDPPASTPTLTVHDRSPA